MEVGFRSVGQGRTFQQGANRSLPEESGMLTGDENIVNVQFSVQYQIKNPVEYLFNVTDQAAVVKNAAEAAMREVIGNSLIDSRGRTASSRSRRKPRSFCRKSSTVTRSACAS